MGWGDSSNEIPDIPNTDRGRKFNAVSIELEGVAKDFSAIRNFSPEFKTAVKELNARIDVYRKNGSEDVNSIAKEMNKILKRIDDGNVFPPDALDSVETALLTFNQVQHQQQGSLNWIDALAMPGGNILAGNTACTEQSSGRWLPKPSDTLARFVNLSDPDIGYKSTPLLWYKMKPVSEMAAFLFPTGSLI